MLPTATISTIVEPELTGQSAAPNVRGRRGPKAGLFEASVREMEARQREETRAVRRICQVLSELPDKWMRENVLRQVEYLVNVADGAMLAQKAAQNSAAAE